MSGRQQFIAAGTPARLVRQLAKLAAAPDEPVPIFPMLVIESVSTRPWSSATFDGEKHRLDIRLHGSSETVGRRSSGWWRACPRRSSNCRDRSSRRHA